MLRNGTFDRIMKDESYPSTASSTNTQKLLINGFSRYPDIFSSKRGQQVSEEFLPVNYYQRIASCILNCLEYIHTTSLRGMNIHCLLVKDRRKSNLKILRKENVDGRALTNGFRVRMLKCAYTTIHCTDFLKK